MQTKEDLETNPNKRGTIPALCHHQLSGTSPSSQGKVIIRQEIYSTRPHQINVLIRMQRKIHRKGIPHHRAVALSACWHATCTNACVSSLRSHRHVLALLIYSRDLGQMVFLFRRWTTCRWNVSLQWQGHV